MAETTDFQGVRAQLQNAAVVLTPILEAVQAASKTFDAMTNAQAHTNALITDVAQKQQELEKLTVAIEKAKARGQKAEEAVAAAESAARSRTVAAEEAADAGVQAAQAAADERVAQINAAVAEAQRDADAKLVDLHAKTVEAVSKYDALVEAHAADITALEKKLNSLRSTAQKLAASLQGQ